jgi:hypothetical protein
MPADIAAPEPSATFGRRTRQDSCRSAPQSLAWLGGLNLPSCEGQSQGVHDAVRAGSLLRHGFGQLRLIVGADLAGQVNHATECLDTYAVRWTKRRVPLQLGQYLGGDGTVRGTALISTLSVDLDRRTTCQSGAEQQKGAEVMR